MNSHYTVQAKMRVHADSTVTQTYETFSKAVALELLSTLDKTFDAETCASFKNRNGEEVSWLSSLRNVFRVKSITHFLTGDPMFNKHGRVLLDGVLEDTLKKVYADTYEHIHSYSFEGDATAALTQLNANFKKLAKQLKLDIDPMEEVEARAAVIRQREAQAEQKRIDNPRPDISPETLSALREGTNRKKWAGEKRGLLTHATRAPSEDGSPPF